MCLICDLRVIEGERRRNVAKGIEREIKNESVYLYQAITYNCCLFIDQAVLEGTDSDNEKQ